MVIEPSCKEMEKLKGDGATGDVNCDTDPSHNQFCVSSEDLESSLMSAVSASCVIENSGSVRAMVSSTKEGCSRDLTHSVPKRKSRDVACRKNACPA